MSQENIITPETIAVMDSFVRPLLANESQELNRKQRQAAEWAVQAGVVGSGLAFNKQIAAHFEHYKDLAGAVWATMLRVVDEMDVHSCPDLIGDLKQKFDAYMGAAANRIKSRLAALGQTGHMMPKETFENVVEETRTKFHNEIELRCRRARGATKGQISIGLNMGDHYTAGQVGAMGPGAHAHDISFQQVLGEIDMRTLAADLGSLRREMKKMATEPQHDIAIGEIAAAEIAAQNSDGSTVLRHLKAAGKAAGKWCLETATKISVHLAEEAIKRSMELPRA